MEINQILEKNYCAETIYDFLSFVDSQLNCECEKETYERILAWAEPIVYGLNSYICEISKTNREELEKIVCIILSGIRRTGSSLGNVPARKIYLMFPNFHDLRSSPNYSGISDLDFKQQGW